MEVRPRGNSSSPSTAGSSSGLPRRAEPPLRTKPKGLLTKTGEGGIAVRLYSNHFQLHTPKDVIIYDYHVSFDPNVEATRFRRALVYENRELFNGCYIFDGGSSIKSLHDLGETATLSATNRHNNEVITISMKRTSTITWGHPEMMRFYNTQMRRNLNHIGLVRIGRNFFDKNQSKRIPEHNIEVWPGVLSAINEHDGGIMMVVNSLTKIIRRETAHDMLRKIFAKDQKEHFHANARNALAGLIVMTMYNSKTYRIDDVIFDKNPETYKFERKKETLNLIDYYQSQYAINIKDAKQPLLLVKPTDRQLRGGIDRDLILIPELCFLTGMSESMKSDFNLRKELDKHIKLDAQQRVGSLRDFMRKLSSNEKVIEEMNQWNLQLDTDLAQITGRVLPPEKVLMANLTPEDGIMYDQRTGSFDSNIRGQNIRLPIKIERWALIAPVKDKGLLQEYMDKLKRVAGQLGVELSLPRFVWINDDRIGTYVNAFREIPDGAKMVHVIVPNNNKDRYSAIKRFFCVDRPIPSQVLTYRILRMDKISIAAKILLQMSVKMGAQAWALIIPPRNVMVVGYNTYRDTSRRDRIVGAFVCSTNSEITNWYSKVTYHVTYDEMCGNFSLSLKAGLKNWYRINRRFPEKIIIYRDGVSEGQIPYVYHNETKSVINLLNEREDLKKTPWCFIIVNKRANARFFAKRSQNDPMTNPIPGTIVDSIVTRRERYDFYLISQCVRVGTVNPTMYNIIYDNTGWKPPNHQALAYKLCHLYYNWAGTISIPAPCQYAYKLAALVGTSIHAEPSLELANNLYYL